jgi:hypothetical protein
LGTLLVAARVLGFEVTEWNEIHGRVVGVFCTIAGIVGAAVGLALTLKGGQTTAK